ncbi:uncharacterized protein LOC100836195 [Brachypodium distachyon]|nr:uncharacterized protein LOC100836195 [Brachypodium distachyon]KQJ89514.1 hypothetical protein BRADI_4g26157v3 [Brachypodium distachyon]|eukprot:XP_003577866.2 uncharacterized protein LOC100836195 [Brachypodium distachyon]
MNEEGPQMDPVKISDGEEMLVDKLCFLEPLCAEEINEDTRLYPRVGDEYQVEIPNLATEEERMRLRSSPVDDSSMFGFEYPVAVGLTIPVSWTQNTNTHIEEECREFSGHNSCPSEDEHNNHSSGNTPRNLTQHSMLPERLGSKVEHDEQCGKSAGQNIHCSSVKRKANDYVPLPGMPMCSWTDEEAQTFLLGLYIFGKNLDQVTKFMKSKTMGEVLSYYYGEFFRSAGYKRWDACRNARSRRLIRGSRIFSGPRQQEFLSRLLAAVPTEARDALLEVFKKFNEGTPDFEQFILCLRSTVGAQVLVEAVGIGKGKYDLTGFPLDPSRKHGMSARAETPIVKKTFSSLSSGDIMKYLTGDFRLSKARSNDLFWEAVWPRLLVSGWHCEKPKDSSLIGKHAFVFLIPGVNKFSRKKLVKGNHYFDSVCDVLRKVASKPRLLDFGVESGNNEGGDKPENGWVHNVEPESALPGKKPPCYIWPNEPGCSSELMKFTVVDTSSVQGEEPRNLRSLRNLPADTNHGYIASPHSGDSGSGNSEELSDSEDSSQPSEDLNTNKSTTDASYVNERKRKPPTVDKMDADALPKIPSTVNGHNSVDQIFSATNTVCASTATVLPVGNQRVRPTNSSTEINFQFDQRVHPDPEVLLAPVSKRRRLVSCKNERTGRKSTAVNKINYWKQADAPLQHVPKANEASAGANPFVRGAIPNSSTNITLDINKNNTYSRQLHDIPHNNVQTTSYKEKAQHKHVIDLNIPQVPSDYEATASYIVPPSDNNTSIVDRPVHPPETKEMDGSLLETCSNAVLGEQLSFDSRRQSTRSCLPTTRALEALDGGSMGTEQNGEDANFPSSNRSSRPVQQPPRRSTDIVAPLSSEGEGSSFHFTNPAIVVDEPRMSNPQDHSAPSDRSSAKVTRQLSARETICPSCHYKWNEYE